MAGVYMEGSDFIEWKTLMKEQAVPPGMPTKKSEVPHVWHTTDPDGGDCYHLAMCKEGAIQAHLLHHGMIGMNGIECEDLGVISSTCKSYWDYEKQDSLRNKCCWDSHCLMYGLSFNE